MPNYQNSRTEENLRTAFAGESMARNRYTYFADIARREGLPELADIFALFAENEKEHARIWAAELAEISHSKNNVEAALRQELKETDDLYPSFAEMAEQEGFATTAKLFRKVADIERHHAEKFQELLQAMTHQPVRPSAAPAPRPTPKDRKFRFCKFCGSLEVAEDGAACPLCKHENAF